MVRDLSILNIDESQKPKLEAIHVFIEQSVEQIYVRITLQQR